MDKENNHIDDLFSDKFDNLEFKTSHEEWSNLSSSLSKVNFFKFSFTSVNVYVVGAGVALASSGGYVGVKHIVELNKTEDTRNKIELVKPPKNVEENALLTDSSTYVMPIEPEKTKITQKEETNKPVIKIQPKNETILEHEVVQEESNRTIDSLQNLEIKEELSETKIDSSSISKPDSSLVVPPRKVIRIKKKVCVKKDSVIRKKTVIIKK